jgi:hypothetical protein
VFQVPNAPTLNVDVDRSLATQLGLQQRSTANDVLITTNSSAQSAPNFWIDPRKIKSAIRWWCSCPPITSIYA